jgi:hypothetical protein
LEEWEGGSTVASSEQKSAIAAEMWRVGWEERRRLRYCDSIWDEMSKPVAWVMWGLRACCSPLSAPYNLDTLTTSES